MSKSHIFNGNSSDKLLSDKICGSEDPEDH